MKNIVLLAILFISANSHLFADGFTLDMDVFAGTTWDYFSGNVPGVYSGWEANYQPPRTGQYLEEKNNNLIGGAGLELTGAYIFSNISIGLVLGYYSNIPFSDVICGQELEWWNPVWVRAYTFNRVTPLFGLSIKYIIPDKDFDEINTELELKAVAQGYNLYDTKYRGVDVYGGENYEVDISNDFIEFGWSYRIELNAYYRLLWIAFFGGGFYEGFISHVANFGGFGAHIGISFRIIGGNSIGF